MKIRATSVAIASVLITSAAASGGAETPLDRVKALIEEKRHLQWENETLRQDLAFASTPSPYIFADLMARTLEFRVRGKTHKSYTAQAVEILGPSGDPEAPGLLRSVAPGALAVLEKAGGPAEIKPPTGDPNAEPTGPADPNSGPKRTDAGVLGVDAPPEYDIALENSVRLQVRTAHEETRWDRMHDSMSAMGRSLADTFNGWLGRSRPVPKDAPKATILLTVDEKTAKALFHSILPGEHFYFVPPPPPPVAIVASANPAPPPAAPSPARPPAPAPSRGKAADRSPAGAFRRP